MDIDMTMAVGTKTVEWNGVCVEIICDTEFKNIKKLKILSRMVDITDPSFDPEEWLVALNGPDKYFFDKINKIYLVR